ncbi:hypothetical protein ACN4EK_09945 [Pantanalinema rosaneae CENA516]|uniref:hypothetical protein n=1 Tax=Pantanalinema rosaneae TaxID=1620701 RepID=UPI003D6F90D0
MISEATHARNLAELDFLKRYMDEIGLESKLVERSPEVPINVLLTAIAKDKQGRDRAINFSYIPTSDEDLEAINLLQLYTSVPCDFNPDYRDALEKLLMAINGVLALGHYNLKPNNELFYRYIYIAPKDELLNQAAITETVLLFVYTQDMFVDLIDAVASGKTDLQTALKELESE